jgi:GcrA cell cycle regulator
VARAPAAAPPLQRVEQRVPAPTPAPRPAASTTVVRAFPRFGGRSCCWPIGEPGTPEFRFCTAEAITGKPYCTEHAAVAYVKARDRREDAA